MFDYDGVVEWQTTTASVHNGANSAAAYILNEMWQIMLPKLLLKLNPATSVKGASFNWHPFLVY